MCTYAVLGIFDVEFAVLGLAVELVVTVVIIVYTYAVLGIFDVEFAVLGLVVELVVAVM